MKAILFSNKLIPYLLGIATAIVLLVYIPEDHPEYEKTLWALGITMTLLGSVFSWSVWPSFTRWIARTYYSNINSEAKLLCTLLENHKELFLSGLCSFLLVCKAHEIIGDAEYWRACGFIEISHPKGAVDRYWFPSGDYNERLKYLKKLHLLYEIRQLDKPEADNYESTCD